MRPRTKRQREILDYINGFVESHGHDPSYSQIALYIGVRSKSGVGKHIAALEQQGLLTRRREGGHFRLELKQQESFEEMTCRIEWLELPESDEDSVPDFELMIPRFMTGFLEPQKLRGFVVPNDAMLDEQIREGDIALIEKKSFARDGDRVVAAVVGMETMIAKYRRKGPNIDLIPANENYDPLRIPADTVSVLGIYRGLLRAVG